MKQPVVIKGMKSGIILALDADMPYDELLTAIDNKFEESAEFLGEASKAVKFTGRKLSEDEISQIIYEIETHSKLHIICVLDDDEEEDAKFSSAIERKTLAMQESTGMFHKGSLRSGQVLNVDSSIVILGDVNPGANVISRGNIIVLGALKGNAFAGSSGNLDAFVVALEMDPIQIRIGDTIARSPDKKFLSSLKEKKLGKNKNIPQKAESKIAFYEDGNIYIEPLGKEVFGDIRL